MPRVDLAGKPIVITGASSGIGAATARACSDAGMPVLLMARRAERLDEVAQNLRSAGGRAETFVGDVTRQDDCDAAVHACVERFGELYAVYANAGFGFEKSALDTTDEELRHIFEVNFFGMMNIIRPATHRMIERGRGHVIACSSCVGKMSIPFYGAYCATKAAQWPIVQAMRGELEPHGVFMSTVHPIGTTTEFFEQAKRKSAGAMVSDNTPSFLMQTPERVARSIVKALRRPKLEVWTHWPTHLGVAMLALSPRFAERFALAIGRKKRARK
jgi:short-subunit dehydrogenase